MADYTDNGNVTHQLFDPEAYYNNLPVAKITMALWRYIPPFLLTIGIVGNMLSMITLTRKNLRKTATSMFLIALSVTDTMVLMTGMLNSWLTSVYRMDMRRFSDIGCRVHWSVTYFSVHMAPWTLVTISLERLVAVYFPTRHRVLFTRARAVIAVAVLCLTFLMFDSLHYVIHTLHKDGCYVKLKFYDFWYGKFLKMDLFFTSLGPFAIMTTMTIAIIIRLILNRKTGKQKVGSLTLLMLVVNLSFLITTSPAAIYFAIAGNLRSKVKTLEDIADLNQAFTITNLLFYVNNSINFLLYVMSSRRFRNEFTSLFKRHSQIHPHSSKDESRRTATTTA